MISCKPCISNTSRHRSTRRKTAPRRFKSGCHLQMKRHAMACLFFFARRLCVVQARSSAGENPSYGILWRSLRTHSFRCLQHTQTSSVLTHNSPPERFGLIREIPDQSKAFSSFPDPILFECTGIASDPHRKLSSPYTTVREKAAENLMEICYCKKRKIFVIY